MAGQPNFEGAKREALRRLAHLPAMFVYHSLIHTRDDVLKAAEHLATEQQLNGDSLLLIRTGALFHDIGFTRTYEGHEQAGADIAAELLPGFGYSEEQVDSVRGMIMATKLPQTPRNLLEEIVADADLDVLGRSDFMERNAHLRQELAARHTPVSDRAWYSQQVAFVEGHRYFTAAARALRDTQKARNLETLSQKLEQAQS